MENPIENMNISDDIDLSDLIPQVKKPVSEDVGRRSIALMLAMKYETETIIRDAEMYREIKRDNNVEIKATTYLNVLKYAKEFDAFLQDGTISGLEADWRRSADYVPAPKTDLGG